MHRTSVRLGMDMWERILYTDTDGEVRTQTYNPYEGLPYSFSPSGKSENFTFSIDNNVEMKVKSDADTTGVKKISLIDQLGASISYNAADKEKPVGKLEYESAFETDQELYFLI